MSVWRKKLVELFPAMREDWDGAETIYLALFDFLPMVQQLHQSQDQEGLGKAYGFAAWCFDQDNLNNAICVCFYEHIPEDDSIRSELHKWLSFRIFQAVRELIYDTCGETAVKELESAYKR